MSNRAEYYRKWREEHREHYNERRKIWARNKRAKVKRYKYQQMIYARKHRAEIKERLLLSEALRGID